MPRLPILQKNAYLSLIIKDNGIWAHIAYTDHNAEREYILSDFTDLNPLKQRLDDDTFNLQFWSQYFDNLEKVFSWDLIGKDMYNLFTFKKFQEEGSGVSGVRILIDDNQLFFKKILDSIREFSKDIAIRILDDLYIKGLTEGLINKLGYDDILYIDLDLLDFSVFRMKKIIEKEKEVGNLFSKSKINWSNEYGVIDSIKDARFKAFQATDLSTNEVLNHWSNFVLNRTFVTQDPNIQDILRSYTTIQAHSIYQDNSEKLQNLNIDKEKTAIFISGYIPRILGRSKTLISIIDGLELNGEIDCYWDSENKVLSYGKSYIDGINASDIILTKKEIFKNLTKVLIPEVKKTKDTNKIIMSGFADSLENGRNDFYALKPEMTYINLPLEPQKVIIDLQFKNGVSINTNTNISFISTKGNKHYDSILIDARPRPVIYGPDIYANKIKLHAWINDNKA